MSTDILVHETATQLRQAVASEAFDSVQTALADYRRHVETVLADWPPDAPPPTELARQAGELMQWALQNPISRTYLENQCMNNRVTAQGYTAWDNIFSGNGYNLRLWLAGLKTRLRECRLFSLFPPYLFSRYPFRRVGGRARLKSNSIQ